LLPSPQCPACLNDAQDDHDHEGNQADDLQPSEGLEEQAEQDEQDSDKANGGEQRTHRGTSDLIEAGRVTPSLERTYPLEQVPDALRHLEAGTVRGKLAVTNRLHDRTDEPVEPGAGDVR
jgi:Zinc-binding dehydrogenase